MNKTETFEFELNFIQNEETRNIIKDLIGKLPDYFFKVGASSTGKYHPNYALGEGGLVRHTKAAVRIANELLRVEMFEGLSEKKDVIIAALLLHDGLKHGEEYSKYVKAEHPVLATNFIMNELGSTPLAYEISDLVITHMGQWNTKFNSSQEIMPKPSTKPQSFVHMCDYLASRKFLEFNFEV